MAQKKTRTVLSKFALLLAAVLVFSCSKSENINVADKNLVSIAEKFYAYVYVDQPVTRLLEVEYSINGQGQVQSVSGRHTNFWYGDQADQTNFSTFTLDYNYSPNSNRPSSIISETVSEFEFLVQRYEYTYDSNDRLLEVRGYFTSDRFPEYADYLFSHITWTYDDSASTVFERNSYIHPADIEEVDGIFYENLTAFDDEGRPVSRVSYKPYYYESDANNTEISGTIEIDYSQPNSIGYYGVTNGTRNLIYNYEFSDVEIPTEIANAIPEIGRFEWFGFSSYPTLERQFSKHHPNFIKTIVQGDGDIYRYYENTFSSDGFPLRIEEYQGRDGRISFEREYLYQ